jgi:hypothetical protein
MDVSNDPQYRTDDGSALRIWKDTSQNMFLSEREGRAIFDEVTYVEVISPGSAQSTPVFELRREFAPEFAESINGGKPLFGIKYDEYKKFVKDFDENEERDASLAGTPLSQWSEMSRTMAASLRAQNVFTVEGLAELPDTRLNIVGPDGRTWREKAKAYIENAKGSAYATKIAADLERERADHADTRAQLQALAAKVASLEAAQGGKPGKAGKVDTPADII